MKALSFVVALAMMPLTRVRHRRGGYFSAHEMATLAALCDCVIPPDHDPGASALGAPRYIDRLLSAFDRPDRVPHIFAGGPFSHRHHQAEDVPGAPSQWPPRNTLREFLPLTRLQELRWRAELFGSAAVAGAAVNDAALGPLEGLREIYRRGLAKVDQVATATAGRPFVSLSSADRERVFGQLRRNVFPPDARRGGLTFVDHLVQHTLEACLALPEYGGNRGRIGWRMLRLEGDSAPLGYSVFSATRNGYVERTSHPVSTPNPDELAADGTTIVPVPLSADGERVQNSIVTLARLLPQ
jgi:gluconate 2-dehydrogenase gamma chain